jgi:hypothetical protein
MQAAAYKTLSNPKLKADYDYEIGLCFSLLSMIILLYLFHMINYILQQILNQTALHEIQIL